MELHISPFLHNSLLLILSPIEPFFRIKKRDFLVYNLPHSLSFLPLKRNQHTNKFATNTHSILLSSTPYTGSIHSTSLTESTSIVAGVSSNEGTARDTAPPDSSNHPPTQTNKAAIDAPSTHHLTPIAIPHFHKHAEARMRINQTIQRNRVRHEVPRIGFLLINHKTNRKQSE